MLMMPTSAIYKLKSIVWVCEDGNEIHLYSLWCPVHKLFPYVPNCHEKGKKCSNRMKPVLEAWQGHLKMTLLNLFNCVTVTAIPRVAM